MICSWRLITIRDPKSLPTVKMLRSAIPLTRSAAEVSKLVVRDLYRGCGVARLALHASILEARSHTIEELLISVVDERRFVGFLERLGFQRVASNLGFKDDKLEVNRPVTALLLKIPNLSIGEMGAQFDTLLDDTQAAIKGHRSRTQNDG